MKYIFAYNINSSLKKSEIEDLKKKISSKLEEKFEDEHALYQKPLDNLYIVVSNNPKLEKEVFDLMKTVYLENNNIELISTKLNQPQFNGILSEGKWAEVDKLTRPIGILDKQV